MSKYKILNIHFFFINVISFFSLPITYFFLGYLTVITYAILLLLMINNIVFILFMSPYFRFRFYLLLVFAALIIASVSGILNFGLNTRVILDILLPVIFFSKLAIIIHVVKDPNYMNLIVLNFKCYAKVCIYSAIITISSFYILPMFSKAYLGLTPLTAPLLSLGLYSGSKLQVFFALAIAFFSGKRALLISSIIMMLSYSLFFTRIFRLKTLIYIILISIGTIGILQLPIAKRPLDKIIRTTHLLKNNPGVIDGASQFRLLEIKNVINDIKPKTLAFGIGPGYTYDIKRGYSVIERNHNNLHFTPLTIISKYGLVLYLTFLFMIFYALFKPATLPYLIMFKLYLIAFLFESMFSYLIFTDRILHFVLGALLYKGFQYKKISDIS